MHTDTDTYKRTGQTNRAQSISQLHENEHTAREEERTREKKEKKKTRKSALACPSSDKKKGNAILKREQFKKHKKQTQERP
jgi:hypothetical protein